MHPATIAGTVATVDLDDLLARWRADPSRAATVAICETLGEHGEQTGRLEGPEREAVMVVGREAGVRHGADLEVLLVIGRAYLAAGGMLGEAQSVGVRAGRLAPEDPRVFRLLGETLLRRGDAIRGMRAFERSLAGGSTDPSTRTWLDRARVFAVIQQARGQLAVAQELERALAAGRARRPGSIPDVAAPAPPAAPTPGAPRRRVAAQTLLGVPSRPPDDAPDESRESSGEDEMTRIRPPTVEELLKSGAVEIEAPTRMRTATPVGELLPEEEAATQVTSMETILQALAEIDAERERLARGAVVLREAPVDDEAGPDEWDSATTPFRPVPTALGPGAVPRPGPRPQAAVARSFDDESSTVTHRTGGGRAERDSTVDTVTLQRERVSGVAVRSGLERGGGDGYVGPRFTPSETTTQPASRPDPLGATVRIDAGQPARSDHLSSTAVLEPGPPPAAAPETNAPPYAVALERPELISLTSDSDILGPERAQALLATAPMAPMAPVHDRDPGRQAGHDSQPPSVVLPPQGPPMRLDELVDEDRSNVRIIPIGPDPLGALSVAEPPPRRRRRWPVVIVLLVVVGAGGAVAFRFFDARRRAADAVTSAALVDGVTRKLRVAGPRDIAEALAAAQRAKDLDPGGRAAALTLLRARTLALLEDDASRGGDVAAAVAQARARGAGEDEVAFAELSLAAAAPGGAERVRALVARFSGAGDAVKAPLFQLAAGAALERFGDAGALAHYEAATRAEPAFRPAAVRLGRALALAGRRTEALAIADSLAKTASAEAEVLRALVRPAWSMRHSGPVAVAAVADLPRSLRSLAWALALTPGQDGVSAGLSAAIDDGDTPAVVAFCGRRALAAGDIGAARQASDKALAMAPDAAPARALAAEIALMSGDLATARKEALAGGDDARDARAAVAYDSGDLAELTALVGAGAVPAAPLDEAPERLLGLAMRERLAARPFGKALVEALAARGPLGELVVVDRALDEGDLARAQSLTSAWKDGALVALRAVRRARLARYEGHLDEARKALEAAGAGRSAQLERALVAAADVKGGEPKLPPLDEPERAWATALVRARRGSGGTARAAIDKQAVPRADAALPVRVVAALALGELGDRGRGEALVKKLLSELPKHPDVVRAAVAMGLLPKSALAR